MHPAAPLPLRRSMLARLPIVATFVVALTAGCAKQPLAPAQTGTTALRSAAASVSGLDTSLYAPGRVIAQLRQGVDPVAFADGLQSAVLGSVPEIRLYLLARPARMTDDSFLRSLLADPRVQFAEMDYAVQTAEGRQSTMAFDEGTMSWPDVIDQGAFDRIRVTDAHAVSVGAGVLVAVLDTGVDLDHPALQASLDLPGFEPGVAVDPGDDRAESVDTNEDGVIDGALGHGTHVAGLILGVAPGARILPVRVLDSDGVGYSFAVARGLVAAVERGAAVANMSLGMSATSLSVEAAIDYARSFGTIVVAPAGNADAARVEFPAAYDPVVAVAGTDENDHKATFSNYGSPVDVAAPSVGILSTYVGGGYATWSGTSMAAPFASGIAALLYAPAGARGADAATLVEASLRGGAMPLASVDSTFGSSLGAGRVSAWGSVTAEAAVP